MTLTDFLLTANVDNDLALAKAIAYVEQTDKQKIGSGQARGFFVANGIWTTLRQIQADINNPLFALADAVIVTASDASSFFGLNPLTSEGAGNIASAQVMVDALIMTAAQRDELLAIAIKDTNPLSGTTLAQIEDIRNPLIWTPCTHAGQAWAVSVSKSDKFTFVTTSSVAGANAEIRMFWATDNLAGTINVLEGKRQTVQGDIGSLVVSQSYSRAQFNTPKEARILRFEYKGRGITDVAITVDS